MNSKALRNGVPLRDLLVLKYPHKMPDAPYPPALTVEFTDACDLKCRYCNNPLFPHPRTYLEDEVLSRLCQRIEEAGIRRVRVGGGEPTLNQNLGRYLRELKQRVRFLSIITNAQWKREGIAEELAGSGVDLIEISIDAGGAAYYEASRQGASYDRLLANLAKLKEERVRQRAKTVVKVRLMVRPSTKHLEQQEVRFLRQWVDGVLPQYILKHPDSDYDDDVFIPQHLAQEEYPRCTLIFKDMQVLMDGRVPLCQPKGSALGEGEKIFVGNIMQHTILGMWNGDQMKRVRNAHRHRIEADMRMCQGCFSS